MVRKDVYCSRSQAHQSIKTLGLSALICFLSLASHIQAQAPDAFVLRSQRRYDSALAILKKETTTPRGRYEYALTLSEAGEHEAAEKECRKLKRSHGTDYFPLCDAHVWLDWKRTSRALQSLKKYSAPSDDFIERERVLLTAALELMDAKYEASIKKLDKVSWSSKDAAQEVSRLLTLARAHGKANHALKAQTAARKAYEAMPNNAEAAYLLGHCTSGKTGSELLKKSSALAPTWLEPVVTLAARMQRAKRWPECSTFWNQALKLDDDHITALVGRLRCTSEAGEMDKAQEALLMAEKNASLHPEWPLAEARFYDLAGDKRNAYRAYEAAADRNKRNPDPMIYAAELALRSEQPSLATGYLDRALKLTPRSGHLYRLYGDALVELGSLSEARARYKKALKLELSKKERAVVNKALSEL